MLGDAGGVSDDEHRAAERAVRLTLETFFDSGHAADVVLAVIAIEFLWLISRGGWRADAAALRLGPAILMMLGLRAALVGADWPWIALPLALSFPVHLADLRRR